MSTLASNGLSGTALAQKMAETLNALADSVSGSSGANSAAIKSIQSQISNLTSHTDALSSFFSTNLNKQFSDVYIRQQEAQSNLSKQIQAEAIRTGNLSQALGQQLQSVITDLQNATIQTGLALAEDQTHIFGLGGTVRQLGDESRKKLIILLHEVQRQVAEANRINENIRVTGTGRISTVQGVMNEFASVIQDYLVEARGDFTDIKERLQSFKKSLNEQIQISEDYLLGLAGNTQNAAATAKDSQAELSIRMGNFATRIKKSLNDLQDERSAMQTRNENEFQSLQTEVQAAVQRVQQDQQKTENDIQSWLDAEDTKISHGFKTQELVEPIAPETRVNW